MLRNHPRHKIIKADKNDFFLQWIKERLNSAFHYARKHPFKTIFILIFFYLVVSAIIINLFNGMNNKYKNVNDNDSPVKLTNNTHRMLNRKMAFPKSDFLMRQNTIRTYIRSNPGLGDQAATINIMSALRERGFDGQFELIYSKAIADKITLLFKLPAKIPSYYVDSTQHITFIAIDEFLNRMAEDKVKIANVGFSVGRGGSPCTAPEARLRNIPSCDSYAEFLHTMLGIDFDPYLGQYSNTKIHHLNPSKMKMTQTNTGFSFFVFPISTFHQSLAYLLNDPDASQLRLAKPGLLTFMKQLNKENFYSMSIYGSTLQNAFCSKYLSDYEQDRNCATSNILQVIAAARYAQLNDPDMSSKPLVLSMLFNFKDEAKEVIETIQHPDKSELSHIQSVKQMIINLDLGTSLEILDIESSESIQKLKSLQAGKIYLLNMGMLPKIVFDGIYTHTGPHILPSIREGMSSLNSLVLTGRPHLRCHHEWELSFIPPDDKSLHKQLNRVHQHGGFCDGIQTWIKNPTLYQQVGNMIISSQNANSAFSKYAEKLRIESLRENNNRIMIAINEAEELLNDESRRYRRIS